LKDHRALTVKFFDVTVLFGSQCGGYMIPLGWNIRSYKSSDCLFFICLMQYFDRTKYEAVWCLKSRYTWLSG